MPLLAEVSDTAAAAAANTVPPLDSDIEPMPLEKTMLDDESVLMMATPAPKIEVDPSEDSAVSLEDETEKTLALTSEMPPLTPSETRTMPSAP